MNYLPPEQIAEAIRESHAAGSLSPSLVECVRLILVHLPRRSWPKRCHEDELLSDCVYRLARCWTILDPQKNAFAFLTSLVQKTLLQRRRDDGTRAGHFICFSDCGSEGHPHAHRNPIRWLPGKGVGGAA